MNDSFQDDFINRVQGELEEELRMAKKTHTALIAEDPFSNPDRLIDNAASDTEAKEEEGHDRIEALKRELSAKITRIEEALKRITKGSYGTCAYCGKPIEQKRLVIMPTATLCVSCEQKKAGRA